MRTFIIILLFILTAKYSAGQIHTDWKSDTTCFGKTHSDIIEKENKKYKKYNVIRTSDNDSILKKYVSALKCWGGERRIVTMQQKYRLEKLNDSTFQVKIKNPEDSVGFDPCRNSRVEDGPELYSFFSLPIGKPNGRVILADKKGNVLFLNAAIKTK